MERSAPPVPLFVAAVFGALLAIALAPPPLAVALLAAAAAAVAWFARSAAGQAAGLLALALSVASLSTALTLDARAQRRAALPEGAAVFEGIASDVGLTRNGSTRIALDVTGVLVDAEAGADGAAHAAALAARIEVFAPPGSEAVQPGDRIRVRGVARPPPPADLPGEIDGELLALSRGVDARLSARAPASLAVLARRAAWRPFPSTRLALATRIRAHTTEQEAGLLLALLVGDTSLLSDEQRTLYRDVGAGHLLAVSGLQVSLLALVFRALFLPFFVLLPGGRTGRATRLAGLFSLALVWAFVLSLIHI